MAKCVNTVKDWIARPVELECSDFIVDDVRKGEASLAHRIRSLSEILLDIANDYVQIKQSALNDGDKYDCSQIQDAIVRKLSSTLSEISAVVGKITDAELIAATKHRYFIMFSSGVIEKLQRMLIIVGRLAELDDKVFFEDQGKLLISEESITIHTMVSIWSASIEIMKGFHAPAKTIFCDQQQDPDEYDYYVRLEFVTAAYSYSKALLMDLILVSWIQFNRLVKYEDLVDGLPLICPCLSRAYFSNLKFASKDNTDSNLLPELLNLILEPDSKPSLTTQSLRSYGVLPSELKSKSASSHELSYFIIWHLYSALKFTKDMNNKRMISSCDGILISCFGTALESYLPRSQSVDEYQLSPHQEERFRLLFCMMTYWCDNNPDSTVLLTNALNYFVINWNLLGSYLDKPSLRIDGLTIFQTFTKLVNKFMPMYTKDGQAATEDEAQSISRDQKDLKDTWHRLLALTEPPPPPLQSSTSAQK